MKRALAPLGDTDPHRALPTRKSAIQQTKSLRYAPEEELLVFVDRGYPG
jgi:hypothetical protein